MVKVTGIVAIFLTLLLAGFWIVNIVKLTDCDFEAPYKCEVLHIAGILPPVALVTAWMSSDK